MIDYETFCNTIEAWKAGQPAPVRELVVEETPVQASEDNTIIYQMPEFVDEDEIL